MFRVAQQGSGLTKAERRAAKLEREAQEFATKGALLLVNEYITRDEYPHLSEEEFQARWEKERALQESILLSQARYRFGEKGQIEDRITDELTHRCSDKKLAQEFVRLIDCRSREKAILMEILIKVLQNQDLCRGLDARQEWEEFIKPYLSKDEQGLIDSIHKERRQKIEAKQQAEEQARRAEEEAHRREVAEQQVAELREQLARTRQSFFVERGGEERGERKRSVSPRDEGLDREKRAREANGQPRVR